MDGQRFDRLARAFATTRTRRLVLKGLAGSAAAGMLSLLPGRRSGPVAAQSGCADGLTDCNGVCVDTAHDNENCAGCGNRCSPGTIGCRTVLGCDGFCRMEDACGGGLVCCQNPATGEWTDCVDLATDADHCGDCL
jgi:hypothetical protein